MQPVTYRRRRNAISGGEREWRVEEHALITRSGTGSERRTPWCDIVGVRLYHEAQRYRPWRYALELHTRQGARFIIDNAHNVGPRTFEDRSASYTPFVRAALQRIAADNPKALALMGETPKRYFFLLLAALIAFGALAFALVVIPTPFDSLPYAALAKLGIILLMLPIFWRWVIGSVPRGIPLSEIPDRAFPPEPIS